MSVRAPMSADELLQRVRAMARATPADAARNFAGVERRLLGGHGGSAETGSDGISELAPVGRAASRAVLAIKTAGWLVFGLASGAVGYVWGRSDARPVPAAVEMTPRLAESPAERIDAPSSSGEHAGPPLPVISTPQANIEPLAKRPPTRAVAASPRLEPAAISSAREAPARTERAKHFGLDTALELLRQAEAALRRGDGLQAQLLLSDLDRRAPPSLLLEERLVTRTLAACAQLDAPRAHEALRELQRLNPESIYRARLESSCVADKMEPASSKSKLTPH